MAHSMIPLPVFRAVLDSNLPAEVRPGWGSARFEDVVVYSGHTEQNRRG